MNTNSMRKVAAIFGALLLATAPIIAGAQGVADANIDIGNSGDTAWVLMSTALVLLMTIPGLSLFYGGLVRTKNAMSVMLQCGAIAAVVSLLWVICGYTLAFGTVSNGWIGSGNNWMMLNLGTVRDATTIPESAYALFQMAFAVITPALMIGAWVDRARFSWVIVFCAFWALVVYAPVAHWIWGGGWLAQKIGTMDFAGGIVVHTTAGVSALVVALLLGKRLGFPKVPMLPHSPALTLTGAALLWVGWYGFNGGSALAADDDAASAILATHVAACAAAMVWMLIERFHLGKVTGIGFATGAVAGLATVTPAAGYISPGSAMIFGLAATVICYPMIQVVKKKLQIDDSLDVFAVHGIGGMTGSILLAIFIAPQFGGTGYAAGGTMGHQLVAQLIGVGVVAVWSAVATALLALGISLFLPMRIGEDEERAGLDISSHGEKA